jgi:hypothetical protein
VQDLVRSLERWPARSGHARLRSSSSAAPRRAPRRGPAGSSTATAAGGRAEPLRGRPRRRVSLRPRSPGGGAPRARTRRSRRRGRSLR